MAGKQARAQPGRLGLQPALWPSPTVLPSVSAVLLWCDTLAGGHQDTDPESTLRRRQPLWVHGSKGGITAGAGER